MQKPVATMNLPAQVGEVRDLMNQKSCHIIPLVTVDDKQEITLQGIVTSDDLIGVYDDTVDIQQVMTKNVVHITQPDADAQTAARIMMENQIHHLVVIEEGRIVGVISSLDFVKLVAEGNF
jgi:CBS domain-containing protein